MWTVGFVLRFLNASLITAFGTRSRIIGNIANSARGAKISRASVGIYRPVLFAGVYVSRVGVGRANDQFIFRENYNFTRNITLTRIAIVEVVSARVCVAEPVCKRIIHSTYGYFCGRVFLRFSLRKVAISGRF